MKKYLIRTFISILVLAQFVVLGLYFRHTRDGVNTLVNVSARSVYALPIGAKDTLYFDDVFPDSVRWLSDKSTRVEQLRTVIGRRISRENLVQATFVVRKKVLSGDNIDVCNIASTGKRISVLKTQGTVSSKIPIKHHTWAC